MLAFEQIRFFNRCDNVVKFGVFGGKFNRLRVDIAHIHALCAANLCRNTQNTASATDVNDVFSLDVHKFEAHSRRCVRAGAESHAGIEPHDFFVFSRIVLYPRRNDGYILRFNGIIVLFPLVFVVGSVNFAFQNLAELNAVFLQFFKIRFKIRFKIFVT